MIYDEIVEIFEVGEMDSIDIEVSGNHYFFANDILTHNSSTDPGLEDTSESFSVPATSDFMFALVSTEEMQNLNQVMVKQLKNRYSDPNINKRFVLGIDRSKMRLYDAEQSAQKLADSGQDLDDKPLNRFGSNEKFKRFDSLKV